MPLNRRIFAFVCSTRSDRPTTPGGVVAHKIKLHELRNFNTEVLDQQIHKISYVLHKVYVISANIH